MIGIRVKDDFTAGGMSERRQVLLFELIARFDVAEQEELSVDHFQAVNCLVSVMSLHIFFHALWSSVVIIFFVFAFLI